MAVAVAKIPTKPRRSVAFADDSSPPSRSFSEQERLHVMMRRHQLLASLALERNSEIIGPFAKDCQKRLAALQGWEANGIRLKSTDGSSEVQVKDRFLLPTSASRFPVTVLDGVLPRDMCRSFINVHEKVGFATPPSLLLNLAEKAKTEMEEEEDEDDPLTKLAYEQAKNTSELVQIESPDFADFLWERLQQFLPDQHRHAGNITSGIYEKCGIIPVFRFMRYQKGQGFKPHRDPQRIYADYPLKSGATKQGEPGIYESFFTIALYLNDPAEFDGGELNFVNLQIDPTVGKTYKSQAAVRPSVGRCVLFSHDELHEGGGVQSGTKYMCQCDVLYKRVAALP